MDAMTQITAHNKQYLQKKDGCNMNISNMAALVPAED